MNNLAGGLLPLWILANFLLSVLMGLCLLLNNGLQLALGFGSVFRSQSVCSIESGLLSWILTSVWLWVFGSLSIGPSLLSVFSRVVYYQPVLKRLDVRTSYLFGTPTQLCYFLVNLARSNAQYRSRVKFLTVQSFLFLVRMPSFRLWLFSLYCCIPLVGVIIAVFTTVY